MEAVEKVEQAEEKEEVEKVEEEQEVEQVEKNEEVGQEGHGAEQDHDQLESRAGALHATIR